MEFAFHSVHAPPSDLTALAPSVTHSSETGHGFEKAEMPAAPHPDSVTGEHPFAFSVTGPEGPYRVAVTLGDRQEASSSTIKAEARGLMVEKVETKPGETVTRTFNLVIKQPALQGGRAVKLKPDERTHADWDERLTLEFLGSHPCVQAVTITPVAPGTVPTVFIAGDSTVTDQAREPYAGWGQMLPRFFTPEVAVSNHAQSGESMRSSEGAFRFAKIFEMMQPGDYLFVQFGHNDQKDKTPGAGAYTTYQEALRSVVQRTREKKGLPVIVTSMERRHFESDKINPSMADYAEAARQVGREEDVPVIDLNAMSIRFYEALGPEKSTGAFVHYPAGAFPGHAAALKDDTHHNDNGAYELARCVIEGLRGTWLKLREAIDPNVAPFDPSQPDAPESVAIPASPSISATKPEGS